MPHHTLLPSLVVTLAACCPQSARQNVITDWAAPKPKGQFIYRGSCECCLRFDWLWRMQEHPGGALLV